MDIINEGIKSYICGIFQFPGVTNLMSFEQSDEIIYQNVPLLKLSIIEELTPVESIHLETHFSYIPCIIAYIPSNDGYVIVDGVKRFNALKKKGIEACFCGIITVKDGLEAGLLRIRLNSYRKLSDYEKLSFLKWMKNDVNTEEYLKYSHMLGISDTKRYEFEQLFDASLLVINSFLNGYIDITHINELNNCSQEDAEVIINLFSKLQFSRQTQRELLEWFPELSFRLKKNFKSLISDTLIDSICNNPSLNDPQKIKKIRDLCFELRFPTLVRAKKEWNKVATELNPDTSSVTFNPSEAFERNVLEVKIKISEAMNACKIMSHLADIPEEKWQKLIYPALLYTNT